MDTRNKNNQSDTESLIREGVIEHFVDLAQMLGIPKSVGQIYGLLFCSSEPLSFGDIVEQLAMSKGSASQGLRLLRNLGAVNVVYKPADRRDFYLAETELRKLANGFLREQIIPRLEKGSRHLQLLSEAAEKNHESSDLVVRLKRLREWHHKMNKLLPWLTLMFRVKHKK